MDREELDPDGAIEDQVADDTDDLEIATPAMTPPIRPRMAATIFLIPIPSPRISFSDGRCRSSLSCL
jgi:hypothetical protein